VLAKIKVHSALVLRPSRVPEKGGVKQKGYSQPTEGIIVTERRQPKSVIPKIGERKLRSGVNWQGALK
jgi:hypothetical protein